MPKQQQKTKKLIPIEDYVHLNRNGFSCSLSYKYRLVRKELNGGEKAPFEFEVERKKIYIVTYQ